MQGEFSGISLIFPLIFYCYVAFCLQTIATKTGKENAWLAWIPIANIYLSCKIADKPGWWVLLCLIPFVNIIIAIVIWWAIAEARNKPGWLGILLLVPIANLIVPGYLAFAD
ncbi:MAG: hypothetical protein JW869_01065 [Candidatus Omnitrophica bacterium]|nr:hypothetical protein [Candidatus Omnitrophota bacterium]